MIHSIMRRWKSSFDTQALGVNCAARFSARASRAIHRGPCPSHDTPTRLTSSLGPARWPMWCASTHRNQWGWNSIHSSLNAFSSSSTPSTQTIAWKDQIVALLERGLVQDAQSAYETVATSKDVELSNSHEREQVREILFDAWIAHQQETLDSLHMSVPSKTTSSSLSPDQEHSLRTIVYAAKMAHNLLEQMEPFLGARNMLQLRIRAEGTEVTTATLSVGHQLSGSTGSKRELDLAMTQRCHDVLAAWAKAVRAVHQSDAPRTLIRAIPQRAQFLLERMEAAYDPKPAISNADTVRLVQPSIQSYNRVLEAWAYSKEHLRGASSERLYQKITTDKANTPAAAKLVRPNTETYRLMVWVWAQSRDQRAAFTATGYLMKLLRRMELGFETDDSHSEPTIADYHVVFRAWARSEEKASPGKAHSLLKLTTETYKKGLTMTQPDETCHRLVLQTAAQRPLLPDLGPLVVDDTLKKMRENFMVPDARCYTAAIRTWKNAALHQPDVSAADQQTGVRRTIELLAEMEVAHNQSTSVSVAISTNNINDVLEALSVSINPRRNDQAKDLLAKLERGWDDKSQLVPNAESYIHTMKVWSSSDSLDKVVRCKEILNRAIENRSKVAGLTEKKDQVVALFNTFVTVCGSYKAATERDGQDVLRDALDAIQMMRTLDTLEPNSDTYATLLDACAKLLPQGRERRVALQTIFQLCCDDGMVNENVLALLRKVAPSDLFAELVLTASETVEGTKVVPEDWTRKALGGKVVSTDGRKTTPLSVDGRLKITMAMKEFKMRRLRDRRNQKLLRGGRLRAAPEPDRSPWRLYNA